ncbi:MAG: AmmeMemoRadiSam system protein A [Phycisphaerae bacterium]|nr:AmmeMemoRadiSam system protein A [Phycisphaerae bacterium]
MLSDIQKKSLLSVARKVIEAAVRGEPVSEFESDDPVFNENRGCFVTMHNHGQLRGCIGQFTPTRSLIKTIREMAIAATQDGRFRTNPVTPGELKDIDVEISVLSPLEKTDDPLSLELGVHGIYIKQGYASGCFLPQVATETGWSKEEFLSQCCAGKAGMSPSAWKEPGTEVLLFTADVFGEKEA